MRTRYAAAEDHDWRRDAGHAAQQDAAPALRLFECMRADLRREPPATSDIGVSNGRRPCASVTVS